MLRVVPPKRDEKRLSMMPAAVTKSCAARLSLFSALTRFRQGFLTGRPNRSLATLDRMVDLHPNACEKGETQLIRALALIDLNRRDEAVLSLKQATEGLPKDNPQRQIELVHAQYKLGELVEARISLGRLLQQYPEHPGARRLQSELDSSFVYLAEQPTNAQAFR